MALIVFNTLTGKRELFKPRKKGKVRMYLCGPTVYDHGHLGHGRSAVAFDVIRRYLEYVYGEKNVTFVTNYTDIDDKMIDRAAFEKITVQALAEKIIPEYQADYAALGIKPPTVQTKATDYIPQMVEIIEKLIKKNHAYELDDGVYFDISTFSEYGKLSGQKQEELRAGARVEKDDQKRHPHDFVLWKKEKPREPSWDSPWGKGRPGWHIECSAMSRANLGQPFDIHGGGMDLMFPHHECEIAQSESAYGVAFCTTWLHNGFITVNKEKMSKSLGNFSTLKQIFEQYPPRVVRYFYLTAHYRSPIEFSEDLLKQAKEGLERIDDFANNLSFYQNFGASENWNSGEEKLVDEIEEKMDEFEKAMDDDFDTPKALSVLFEIINIVYKQYKENTLSNLSCKKAWDTFYKINEILNVNPIYNLNEMLQKQRTEIDELIDLRNHVKSKNQPKRVEEIEEALYRKGVVLKEIKNITKWWWEEQVIDARRSLTKIKNGLKGSNGKNTQSLKSHIDVYRIVDLDNDDASELSQLISDLNLNPKLLKKIQAIEPKEILLETIQELDEIIEKILLGEEKYALIRDRETARAAKNWKRSDELRNELLQKGIVVEDTPHGTVWKKA